MNPQKGNNFLVILDGPRGAGKSTVGQALADRLTADGRQAIYFKKVKRVADAEFANMMDHISLWQKMGGIVVVDRFALSEWVMSVALNRSEDYSKLTKECRLALINACDQGMAVVLTATQQVLGERMALRGERTWDMDPNLVEPLWRAASGTFDVPLLDTTNKTLDEVVDLLYKTVNALLIKHPTAEVEAVSSE